MKYTSDAVLTRRERDVLVAWIQDDRKDRVAFRLQISTAATAALVARALQDGLVKIEAL